MSRSLPALTTLAVSTLALLGCSSGAPKPLNPATFIQPLADTRIDQRRTTNDDRSGQLLEGARVDQSLAPSPAAPPTVPPAERPIDQPLPTPDMTSVSPVVSDSVKTPADAATQRATTTISPGSFSPAPPLTSPSSGEYMTLGAVVVQVNGNPIYANKIIGEITPILAAKARETTQEQFAQVAKDEVQKQTGVLIQSELEYAAAQRNLDSKDQKLATDLTTQWKNQQIVLAGGSAELAREHALADGRDFDDLTNEQYRVEMRRIYFQKKEFPKLQITARDMRDFYAQHREELFTQREQAKFRLIKINFSNSSGHAAAMDKISSIRSRLLKGEDFAKLAADSDDDDSLKQAGGDAGFGDWIQRGAFANEKIEDAVWKLDPGQITPVIELPHQFVIAKLDEKQGGAVQGFERPEVQSAIHRALEAQQFNELRRKAISDLTSEAIISPDPPHWDPAIDMAIQMYPIWSKKK